MRQYRVAIVGGGITGLAAAYQLQQWSEKTHYDLECTVYEASDRFGGKIDTYQKGESLVERGPDSIFTLKTAGTDLIEELGLHDQIVRARSTGTSVIHHAESLPLPSDLYLGVPSNWKTLVSSPVLSVGGKIRALADLVLPRSRMDESRSLGALLRERFGHEVVDRIAAPLLAGIHSADIDRMGIRENAKALEMLSTQYRSLLAGARKTLATRSSTGERKVPFVSLQGGLSSLTEELVRRLESVQHLRIQTSVHQLTKSGSGGYRVYWGDGQNTRSEVVDAVILATPAFVTAKIAKPLGIPTQDFEDIRYVSTATVIIGFAQHDLPSSVLSSGFLVPRTEGMSITACTVLSYKWPTLTQGDIVYLRCYVGRDGSEDILQRTDTEILQIVISDLEKISKKTLTPEFYLITRWPNSMPQYDIGHGERVERLEQQLEHYPGLFIAGAAYRGMGIPDCIQDGIRSATSTCQYVAGLTM